MTDTDFNISRRLFHGSVYSISASIITLIFGATRSILLARLLLPAHFGVVALALFYINLATTLRGMGLDMALIHKQDTDENFLKTYFSLRTGLDVIAFGILIAFIPVIQNFYPQMPSLGTVMTPLIFAYFLVSLSQLQETFLRKNFLFNRLAIIDVTSSIVMTITAPFLAWKGWGIWALVAENASGFATRFLLSWGLFIQWKPRLGYDRDTFKWLMRYGGNNWVANNLTFLLDRFDDFWIGTSLGGTLLGFYSRAYEFAHYPRRVIANQLVTVFTPAFAKFQGDRLLLSKSFYRSAYIILRSGLMIAGLMALVMPEFIHSVIGDKWLPMLWTFRIMLIYTIVDPILMLVQNFLLATGNPQELRKISVLQTLFFIPAVVIGAYLWDIHGVAMAANLMLLIGLIRAYRPIRNLIDFSTLRLIGKPLLAFSIAWVTGYWAEVAGNESTLVLLALKTSLFIIIFSVFLFVSERQDLSIGWRVILNEIRSSIKSRS